MNEPGDRITVSFFNLDGFIEITSHDQVLTWPNYAVIQGTGAKPTKAIALYKFKEKIKCGYCGTPHKHGYLTETDRGDTITNIGHECGHTHLGIEFKEMTKDLEQRQVIYSYKAGLNAFLTHYTSILDQAEVLLASHKAIERAWAGFNSQCPRDIFHELERRAQRNDDVVTTEYRLSDDEMRIKFQFLNPDERANMQRVEYRPVGRIKGLSTFKRSVPGLLTKEVLGPMRQLAYMDKTGFHKRTELKRLYDWSQSVSLKLEEAKWLMNEARDFFQADNIAQFVHLRSSGRHFFSDHQFEFAHARFHRRPREAQRA